jgi:MFS family permease
LSSATPSRLASPIGGARAWLIWSLSAIAFSYAFFQRVAPSVMVSDLMETFSVGAAVLGQLSAFYFYPYVLLQIPIGVLLDRFGVRVLLSGAMALAAVGTVAFGLAQSLELAYAGRFLIGVGSAVGFIGSMALAAQWFPVHRFALLAGLAMLMGMAGGFAGQAPLATLVDIFGWRATMLGSGVVAGALAIALALVVRNSPGPIIETGPRQQQWAELRRGLVQAVRSREIWIIAITATSMAGPLLAFGSLWGVPYLIVAYDLPRPQAALLVSMMLVGWALGAPAGGWVSDYVRRRKAPLVVSSAASLVLMTILIVVPQLPLWALVAVIFGSGVAGGHMVIGYALAREVSPPGLHGSVMGLVNTMTVASGAVLQPLIGSLLDAVWDGTMAGGVRVYQASDYRLALASLVVWAAMGFATSLFLRETRCRPAAQTAGSSVRSRGR